LQECCNRLELTSDREAQVFFEAGKNRNGWFDNNNIMKQTTNILDIFKKKTSGQAVALCMFNNAPSH
jgi:hypothetical protein